MPELENEKAISFYLKLEGQANADLEVVSRASLAFSEVVRELAYVLDPSMEIRIELVSGTEGSLRLNAIIRSIRSGSLLNRQTLISIASAAAGYFVAQTGDFVGQRVLTQVLTSEERASLSDDDVAKIADRVTSALQQRIGAPQAERVYRELETDTAISGVGVAGDNITPTTIVPRVEFRERSGTNRDSTEEVPTRRSRIEIRDVTLISPVLISGSRRKWRFSGIDGEFGATILDNAFLENITTGRTVVAMVSGIVMQIELEIEEERRGDLWHSHQRNVLRVLKVSEPPSQENLAIP